MLHLGTFSYFAVTHSFIFEIMLLFCLSGRVLWTREEALANVVAAEFVELPVSELDAAIESEFDQKEGSFH